MNSFVITGFFMGVTALFLGLIILRYGNNKMHYACGFQNIGIAIWGFCNGFAGLATSAEQALFWWKIAYVPAFYVIVLSVHHALLINNIKQKIVLTVLYLWATAFPVLCIFNFIKLDVKYTYIKYAYTFVYLQKFDTWLMIYAVVWLLSGTYAMFFLVKAYRNSTIYDKKSFGLYVIAYPMGWLGGGTYAFKVLGIDLIYPYTQLFVPLYCALITYSIFRYRLFDLDVFVKKTIVFTGLLAMVLVLIIVPTLLMQEYVLRGAGLAAKVLGLLISCIAIIIAVKRIESFLTNMTDRYLFQKKYGYQQILRSFIEKVITASDPSEIVAGTVDLISNTVRPEKISIFLLNRKTRRFIVNKNIGYNDIADLDKLPNITEFLSTKMEMLLFQYKEQEENANSVILEMKANDIHIAIPIVSSKELLGVILLGKKKSDEYYTPEDIAVLMDLGRTEAIAIKNSMVIQELAEEKKIAALGEVATSISHNINNHLNRARVRIQEAIYTEDILTKLKQADASIERAELVNTLAEYIKRTTDCIDAGADVVKKARDFARPTDSYI